MTGSSNNKVTGREPRLSASYGGQGKRLISLRNLATMLNVLPPTAISLGAAEEALRSTSFYVRYGAAELLGKRGDRDARMVMQKVLTEGNAPSRATVARHLGAFSWFSVEPQIRQALGDADSRVREGAVYALCDMRELNSFLLLTEILQKEEDNVRAAAAWGLRECEDPAAVPVLEAVLLAADPEVRVKALEALGANGTVQAMPVIRQAMNDPEPDVKYAATLSLLEVAGESWLQELSGIVGRTSGVTRQQILRGFFHATNYLKIDVGHTVAADTMIDALETALFDEMPAVRIAAIWPLAWMNHERTPSILRGAYFREEDPEAKAQIARVAINLMSAVGEEILEDARHSSVESVRLVAERIDTDRARMTVAPKIVRT